jgi:hypothetical protein
LIIKAFIIEKFLDTLPLPLLTFAQKVLTVLPPLELFSLERKSHLLPGGFFVCVFKSVFTTETRRRSELARCGSKRWRECVTRKLGDIAKFVVGLPVMERLAEEGT